MAWGDPEEDDEVYSSVGSALANPAGTYADETGAAPEETPKVNDGSPSTVAQQQDQNKDADEEANYIAGNSQGPAGQQKTELDDAGLPDEREGVSNPPDEVITTTDEPGDSADQATAELAGGSSQTYKAPAPLVYKPYEDHAADYQALVQQKASEDPSKFQPSAGRRVAGGIAAALVGAGTRNAGEGMNVGREVTSAPLRRAQEEWAAKEAPLEKKIEADKAADQAVDRSNQQATNVYNAQERNLNTQARVDEWNALAQQRRATAQAKLNTVDKNTLGPVDPNNPFGEWQGKTPSGKVVRGLEPPASIQKDPRYIQQQRRQNLAEMQRSGVNLSQQEAKYYLINGKLAEPTTHISVSNPSEELERYNDWKTQFKQQNGRAPNADETYQFHFRDNAQPDIKPNLAKTIKDNKDRAMSAAQRNYSAAVAAAKTPEDAAAARQQYEQDLQEAQDKFEGDIQTQTHDAPGHTTVSVDEKGNPVFKDEGGNTMGPAGGPPAARPQQAAPQQQPQVVIQDGNGQQLTDKSIAAKYLQKAGGNKQLARQLAQKDNWKF